MQRRGQSGVPTKVQRRGPKAHKAPNVRASTDLSERVDSLRRERAAGGRAGNNTRTLGRGSHRDFFPR